ncbi:hypothetical protein N0V90_012113 [Kalmusia sp. IMI 367209]|nr:hypothetical protein N0V90_012113 [Kalmusia sp. IMI 367209]
MSTISASVPERPARDASLSVVAVSRSQPATHTVHSQPTVTAIVRKPSKTPLVLTPSGGIEGHKSAVHDAQVYAFFSKHYDYWTSHLGVERATWDWAFWGENLTIKTGGDLDERSVFLGDRWLFSSGNDEEDGVVLEVVGGRNPCSRLAWRCGQPASWLAEVAKSGFCGVYLNVVRGGVIKPGDTAKIVPTKYEDRVPAASISQCAFGKLDAPETRSMAERILRIPGLQNMNQQVIARKLALIRDKESVKQGRWPGWRPLEIVKVVDESATVKSFYFAAADEKPLAIYLPGQFLTFKLPSGLVRQWSISSWSPESTHAIPNLYRISVKKEQYGSLELHTKCSIGDRLLVRSPAGSFVPEWSREFPPRQIYISAGIGITPMLAMLQAHFSHVTLNRTPAIFIHVARNSKHDVPLSRSDLPSSPLLRVIRFYSAPISGVDVEGEHFDYAGRPSAEFFAALLGASYEIDPLNITPIGLPGFIAGAYICGPPAFVSDVRGYLEAARVPPPAILSETFSDSVALDADADMDEDIPAEAIVKFSGKAIETKWKKDEALSLLQLAEREDLEPDYGCRAGDCGACEVKILKGEARVLKSAAKEAQEASGKAGTMIRTCCSVPASTLLELEF